MEENYLDYTSILPPIPKYFIKIPSDIILDKELNEMRILCFHYLNQNLTSDDTVMYCANYMIQFCGYKKNINRNRKSNTYTKLTDCMSWFHRNGYIVDFDTQQYKGVVFQCSYADRDKIRSPERFGIIYDFEIKKILEYKADYRPLSSSVLLLVLSYLRLMTWKRKNDKDTKPEICRKKYIDIASDIGISERLASRAIHTLSELGFIAIRTTPNYQTESGEWRTEDTIFATPYKFISKSDGFVLADKEQYDFMEEIERGLKQLQTKTTKNKGENK